MKNKILFVVTLLFGLMMINSGLNKFFMYMPVPEMGLKSGLTLLTMAESGWLFELVGFVEIVGSLLLILPKTRALGAIMLLPVTTGILLFHVVQEPNGLIVGIIMFLLNGWFIYENKAKYMPMVA